MGIAKLSGVIQPTKITKLFTFRGLERDEAEEVAAGDICAIAGVEGIQIGESITDLLNPAPLEPLLIDEPTLTMVFTVNTSPVSYTHLDVYKRQAVHPEDKQRPSLPNIYGT